MLDEDGLSVAPPEQEPLKTAFDLEPTFPIDHLPFAEPATVRGLERRSLFNRLDAAVGADVYLFQRAQRFLRHRPDSTDGGRPDVSEKLALALSVWAWTRSRLGLEDDGLVAMGRALEWSQDAGSCLRGYVYQRSARMLLDQLLSGTSYGSPSGVLGRFIFQDILRELEEAREDHMKSERGEAAVTETVLDLGTAFTSIDQHHPGHRLLYIGLELPGFLPDFEYFNLLPILMVVLWILQQRGMPQPQDEQAARMQKMMMFMPVVFGFMLYNYAAGLSLYMITSSGVAIFEQKVIKKMWPIDDTEVVKKSEPSGCGPFSGFMEQLAEKQKEHMKRMEAMQRASGGNNKKRGKKKR